MAGLTIEAKSPGCVFGTKSSPQSCKSEPIEGSAGASSQIPSCPRCGSRKTWRDGHFSLMFGEPIQRWKCRECEYRFSDLGELAKARKAIQEVEIVESMKLRSSEHLDITRQICVAETKNLSAEAFKTDYPRVEKSASIYLDQTTQQLVVPQKSHYDIKDMKGAVLEFIFYLQQQNRAGVTQTGYAYNLDFLVNHGANLFDPFSVKDVLANKLKDNITQKDKTNVRKYTLLKAYKSFANAYGIDIKPANFPKYKPTRGMPYLPPETHMDQLIAACGYIMAAYLQLLKETAARPVEACRILWEELDFVQRKIPINHPAKDCNPRVLDMSEKLYNMLKTLEHLNE